MPLNASLLPRPFLWSALYLATAIHVQALTASFNSATDVPVTAASYTAVGSVAISLNFAPATGTSLTVVRNTGLRFIDGAFSNLAQGQAVALTFDRVTYNFVANYYGGTGNDLVLQWANARPLAWGFNDFGQLGNNSLTNSAVPAAVGTAGVLSGKSVIALASGASHSLGLCLDGAGNTTLAAWGLNGDGQLGINSTADSLVPVTVNTAPSVSALHNKTVVAVAAGFYFSLALCSDGTLAAWGSNDNGQLGNGSTSESLVPVAVDQTGVTLPGENLIAVAAGVSHCLALRSDGKLFAWGSNGNGQLGNNSLANSSVPVAVNTGALAGKTVVAVAAGSFHSLALCSDGTLAAWGNNLSGQLGDTTTSDSPVPVAVNTAQFVSALYNKTVLAVSAGYQHSLALCSDGTLATWGYNGSGQLGNNNMTVNPVPAPVAVNTTQFVSALYSKTVIGVSGGYQHSLALCSDGTLAAWGLNDVGQIGDGTLIDRSVPVPVLLAPNERFVAGIAGPSASHTFGMSALPPPPPTATTLAATSVTGVAAILQGSVNASGSSPTVSFDLGTSPAYGVNLAGEPASVTGNTATAVSTALLGLTPGTTYHFRVNASTGLGSVHGADLTFTTLRDNASLQGLTLSAGSLEPGFASGTTNYLASVSNTTFSLTVTPTVADSAATVTVNGVPVTSGFASGAIPLSIGANTLTTVVTAQDGSTQQSYSVLVTRETAIQSWRQLHFGTPLAAGDSDDAADPNHNGISNLFEYTLNGHPTGNSGGAGILPQPAVSGTNRLQLVFNRYLDRNDITLTVQASDALTGPWTDLAQSVHGAAFVGATAGESGAGNTRVVTVDDLYLVTDPAHPTRFMRLKVSNP